MAKFDGQSDFLTVPDSSGWDMLGACKCSTKQRMTCSNRFKCLTQSNNEDWTIDFHIKKLKSGGRKSVIVKKS